MTDHQSSISPAPDPFGTMRLAVTLVEANALSDEEQVIAVLAAVPVDETGAFLVALAEMVTHAYVEDPSTGFQTFLAHYRGLIDEHEAAAGEADQA